MGLEKEKRLPNKPKQNNKYLLKMSTMLCYYLPDYAKGFCHVWMDTIQILHCIKVFVMLRGECTALLFWLLTLLHIILIIYIMVVHLYILLNTIKTIEAYSFRCICSFTLESPIINCMFKKYEKTELNLWIWYNFP